MTDIMATVEPKTHGAGMGGTQRKFRFDNGYGASVVTGFMTGGADFELAVLGPDGNLVYDTPVTGDVERGNYARMNELLTEIKALPEPVDRILRERRAK